MEAAANTQDAKTPDQKAGSGEDLSMEEILQSIRRIIADDDNEGKKTVAAEPKANGNNTEKVEDVPGSEVLELTEMMPEAAAPAAAEPKAPPPADVLGQIDKALTAPLPPPPAAAPAPVATAPAGTLVSENTAAAAASAFEKLRSIEGSLPLPTTPSAHFRTGNTVEDLVCEMLKPMMKEWLDANLPAVVESIVEREVKKLTR